MNNYTITIAYYESMMGQNDLATKIHKWYATMHEIGLSAEGADQKEALDNLLEKFDEMTPRPMPIPLHTSPNNSLDPNIVLPDTEPEG